VASTREFCRIAEDVELGEGVQIHAFVNLYGCRIGDGTRLGTFVEVQKRDDRQEVQDLEPHVRL